MSEPRIVCFDLETIPDMREVMKIFPRLGDYPGLTLKATVNSIICFGWKVLGEPETRCLNSWDLSSDLNDDYELCVRAYDILVNADAIVTHNGRRFDWKFLQTRLLKHGLPPLPKINHIDTCSIAKANLYFFNNKLDTIAQTITRERKLDNGGWDLWVNVSLGCKESRQLMSEYCKQDVVTLEAVFRKLRPLTVNAPNHNVFTVNGSANLCPLCGSSRLNSNGTRVSKTRTYRRYQCQDCGSWSHTDTSDKMPRCL